jgi:hypothetical protein
MLLVLRKAPRLASPHVARWRWEHVSDSNGPAWRKLVNRYSAGNIPEAAAAFVATATWWALHKQTRVDRDATRLGGEAHEVPPLAAGSVMSRLVHCYAIVRIETFAADHMGNKSLYIQRSVFTEAGIKRAIHTTRIGQQAIHDGNRLSLDRENAFNTISRRRFLAQLYKNPDLHPIIPLVEMIHSRGSTVY